MTDDRSPIDEDYIPTIDEDDEEDHQRPLKARHALLCGWLVWLVFTIALSALLFPNVLKSIRQSGVLELIETHRTTTTNNGAGSELRTVYPYFIVPGRNEEAMMYQNYPVKQIRTGQGIYHDTMEALLAGPPQEALAQGAITYIAPETRLRGLSESNGIIYVDLNGAFVDSSDGWPGAGIDPAVLQIRKSLLALDGVRDVVIMLDGEVTKL
ncbi:MAG: GerMN domain-containing protein [Sphaerochaetaceae bacterium]|nr:GerMN domain-containing protein [Sphaerochaetaceae bacterium]